MSHRQASLTMKPWRSPIRKSHQNPMKRRGQRARQTNRRRCWTDSVTSLDRRKMMQKVNRPTAGEASRSGSAKSRTQGRSSAKEGRERTSQGSRKVQRRLVPAGGISRTAEQSRTAMTPGVSCCTKYGRTPNLNTETYWRDRVRDIALFSVSNTIRGPSK